MASEGHFACCVPLHCACLVSICAYSPQSAQVLALVLLYAECTCISLHYMGMPLLHSEALPANMLPHLQARQLHPIGHSPRPPPFSSFLLCPPSYYLSGSPSALQLCNGSPGELLPLVWCFNHTHDFHSMHFSECLNGNVLVCSYAGRASIFMINIWPWQQHLKRCHSYMCPHCCNIRGSALHQTGQQRCLVRSCITA